MKQIHPGEISVYQHALFDAFPNVVQITTTRCGGVSHPPYDSFNLGDNTNDKPEHVTDNMNRFVQNLTKEYGVTHFALPNQVHGNRILSLTHAYKKMNRNTKAVALASTDGLITNCRGIFIGIKTADCLPVCLLNSENKTIAVAHAGWRGIVNGILLKTVKKLASEKNVHSIYAAIGPAIEGDKYEVGLEVIDQFKHLFPASDVCRKVDGRYFVDLKQAAKQQLINAGVQDKNIEVSQLCTWKHNDRFYSHRKSRGGTGRFVTGMLYL